MFPLVLAAGGFPLATGGTVTEQTIGGTSYRVHKITADDTFTVLRPGDMDYAIVPGAGAGAGGHWVQDADGQSSEDCGGDGGSAGTVLSGTQYFDTGDYDATIGAGGTKGSGGKTATDGGDGADSTLETIGTASGGLGGGANFSGNVGGDGGDGHGSSGSANSGSTGGDGGDGFDASDFGDGGIAGGGGGGAGGVGSPGSGTDSGSDGGDNTSTPPSDPAANTGAGGGGGASSGPDTTDGANGADGVIYVRYPGTVPVSVVQPSYVDADSVGSPDDNTHSLTVTVSIGTGTDRKLFIGIGAESLVGDGGISSVTFDPGGGDEASATAVTSGSVIANDGSVDQQAWTYFYDIPSGVSSGSYDIEVDVLSSTNAWGFGVIALQDAAAGQPEQVATDTALVVTSVSDSITTQSDDAMVCDIVSIGAQNTMSPDDGQTERWDTSASASGVQTGGATKPVSTAGAAAMGWTFSGSTNRVAHVMVSIAGV